MSGENFAGNIIVNLANLPDFLRKPILKKRMTEFFTMSESEKNEIINNALEAGPSIPFTNFSKLFKTWLEILAVLPEEQREVLVFGYVDEVSRHPQKLIDFNLDGILEIFLTLSEEDRKIISKTIKKTIDTLDNEGEKVVSIIIPDNAKIHLQL